MEIKNNLHKIFFYIAFIVNIILIFGNTIFNYSDYLAILILLLFYGISIFTIKYNNQQN